MWSIVKFLLILFAPMLISKGLSFLFKGKDKRVFTKTRLQRYTIYLSTIYISYLLLSCFWWSSENVFQTLQLSLDCKSFEIRDGMKLYVEKRSKVDPVFAEMIQLRNPSESSNEVLTKHEEVEREYLALKTLANTMKSQGSRMSYFKHGHRAFTRCSYCQDDTDYLIYNIPSVSFPYIIFLCFLGLLTAFPSKSNWFSISLVALVILYTAEWLVHLGFDWVQPDFYDFFFSTKHALQFQKMEFVRSLAFLVMTSIIMAFDYGSYNEEKNAISRIINLQSEMLNRAQALRLQRAAVMSDSKLRKAYMEHFTRIEGEKEQLLSNPDFQKYQKDALNRYNLDSLIKDAMETVDSVIDLMKKDS